jgi:hypothetical protein
MVKDVRNSEAGRRGSVRVRLHGVAVVAAPFTALVGGVALSGYASLNAANTAENKLGTLQALALEAQTQQQAIRSLAWFGIAVGTGGVDRPMSEVRNEFDAARARLQAAHDNLAGVATGTAYAPRKSSRRTTKSLLSPKKRSGWPPPTGQGR